jgi:hypothetical protein
MHKLLVLVLIGAVLLWTFSTSAQTRQPDDASNNCGFGWNRRISISPKDMIAAIKRAIAAEPKRGDNYFNLAACLAMQLQPPDKLAAREAYKRALALGQQRDEQLEKALQ